MEKAKLLVRETKNKKFEAKLQLENGKIMPLPQLHLKDTALNGSAVEVERQAGKVVRVQQGDKVLYNVQSQPTQGTATKPQRQPGGVSHQQRQSSSRSEVVTIRQPVASKDWNLEHISYVRNPAYAPYNFVPLNREVVEINPIIPPANKYDTGRNTGWIEVEIDARTPLYIRGTLTKKEVGTGQESKNKPDFFAPAGRIRIPGSSLRGMVRNMVEMVSFGRFHFFEDRRLYYRGLADRSNLRTEYQSRMSSFDSRTKSTTYKMNAGYLIKDGSRFGIIPAQIRTGKQFDRIAKAKTEQYLKSAQKIIKFENYTFFASKERGTYIVISGYMPNKKHDWEINPPDKDAATIWLDENNESHDQSDIQNYYLDRRRNAVNLIMELENNGTLELPCFYVQWIDDNERKRVSFGHTAMFRLAYEKTIGEHLLEELKNKGKIDFADAVFGNEHSFAGRVFFEDAFLSEPQSDPQLPVVTPQVLSTPKPTTFQHYLVQNSVEVRQLNHYNSNTALRGYKFYWHKSGETERWRADERVVEQHGTQYTRIQPAKKGAKFSGRIRFENLSGKELGALLFALDLPEGCAHKLGMGKPLGLGSVRLTPKLFLSKREQRYRDFFAEWDNQVAASNDSTLEYLKRQFEEYVLEKIGEDKNKRLWEVERLRELLVMLRVEVGRELEKIGGNNYMRIEPQNEFKNRYVLPKASRVVPATAIEDVLTQLRNQPKPSFKEPKGTAPKIVVQERSEPPVEYEKIRYIKKIEIKGLWDKFDIDWPVDKSVSILVGINASGKSTILELINHALADEYLNPEKVKYPPQEFTIIFDNEEKLSYQRTESGITRVAQPRSRLLPYRISTFDSPPDSDEDKKLSIQIERQLTSELWQRIDDLFVEEFKTLDQLHINPRPILENFLYLINEEVFPRNQKKLEFVGEIKFTKGWLSKFLESNKVLDDLRVRFEAMVNDSTYKLNREFPNLLESKVEKYFASRFRSQILQHVEFVEDSPQSQAIFRLNDGRVLMPDQLSSGEKQILIILFTALILKFRMLANPDLRHVLIIDEPENSLHLKWQKSLISYIRRLNDNVQIIIATHAPAIIKKGYMENTVEMNQIKSVMEG